MEILVQKKILAEESAQAYVQVLLNSKGIFH